MSYTNKAKQREFSRWLTLTGQDHVEEQARKLANQYMERYENMVRTTNRGGPCSFILSPKSTSVGYAPPNAPKPADSVTFSGVYIDIDDNIPPHHRRLIAEQIVRDSMTDDLENFI